MRNQRKHLFRMTYELLARDRCVFVAIKGAIHDHSPFTQRAKQGYLYAESFMEWARNSMTIILLFCSVIGNKALFKTEV